MNFYDWKDSVQLCKTCGWKGFGHQAEMGESFDAGAEYHCPQCDTRFGYVTYPLATDVLSDDRASAADRGLLVSAMQANHRSVQNAELGRLAKVPVRYRFRDYVCVIQYSDESKSFSLVKLVRADGSQINDSTLAFKLYKRVLQEPPLRAMMLEALVPSANKEIDGLRETAVGDKANEIGFWVGFCVFLAGGILLYLTATYLNRVLGKDWGDLITFVPSFFAVMLIFPVQRWFARLYMRSHCDRVGHKFENLQFDSKVCIRCHLYVK